jgi:GntR family transcriptional regulator, rspAB operon transcriptional repressor
MGRSNPTKDLLSPADGQGPMKRQAYTALKRFLVSGPVDPGLFLSERQLAKQLGMSNTPVRAALERLEAEGYIAISPQQGIVVRELSIQEIIDHYELREVLEAYAIRKLAGHLTVVQIERVHAVLDEQRRNLETRDLDRNVELDAQFHTLFCDFLGNDQITRVMLQLRDKIHRAIVSIATRDQGRIVDSYQEHLRIADAVIAGEADQAAALLVAHLEAGRLCILSPRRHHDGASTEEEPRTDQRPRPRGTTAGRATP